MVLLRLLLDFLKALNQKASPRALAGGFALGAIVGLTPAGSLHNLAVFFLAFLLPVHIGSVLVGWAFFALFAWVLDPAFNALGLFLLTRPGLRGLWTALYNTPVFPWTRFNNTLTLGSLAAALLLFYPIFAFAVWGVTRYRERFLVHIQKYKIVQALKATKFAALLARYL